MTNEKSRTPNPKVQLSCVYFQTKFPEISYILNEDA